MSLSDFFSPIAFTKFIPKDGFYASQLGNKIEAFTDAFQHTVFQLGGNATIGKGILRTQML